MADARSIINLGLGKIAAGRVNSISPPKSPLENHCALGYPQWRDSELEKKDWAFALDYMQLSQAGPHLDIARDGRKYRFAQPNDLRKPIRDDHTTWEQRGRFFYDSGETLLLPYIKRAVEGDFTALFIEVLACRVALECVEYATQSNTKGETIQAWYNSALRDAARANAFIIGPQQVELEDDNSSWITSRFQLP